MEESVVILGEYSVGLMECTVIELCSEETEIFFLPLELKKLLQQREKELQDKTKELETTSEMLKTKTSLLLYTDMDLESMNKLANQNEEHLKNMMSELKACKRQVETLGQKLQEKTMQVDELQAVVKDKGQKKHLQENCEEQHFTGELY